ncbi:MAG: phosphorylase family protein [Caulobacteraceae bacterium]
MILAAVGMQREARLVERHGAGIGVRAVAGGGRAELLEARLKAALEGAEAILSIGIGGALDPSLEVGDVVVGSEVLRPRRRWETDSTWRDFMLERLPGARSGAIYGSDEMVLHALDKAKLRGRGGAALVDMESHVAAKVAAARGLPLAVLRVVSDTATTSLPEAVRAGLAEDGSMNLMGVLSALARDPRQLPALIRVGRDADIAFKALDKAAARALARP